ncbi:C6 transcription factor [Fusarium beomiforme]|uniref:C6 transcription factor n=1 Tax=Fusarium beomiforme TaxID=44412 RepID=A0A9P5E0Y5_9HYPO|nr:C6 transcription factor [Fusarium beomiforme]
MDPLNTQLGGAGNGPAAGDAEVPSCQGCRRRKLRCSRDKPMCNHCQRLDSPCVYDTKKNKPGIKTGVIEGLNRRVEALENTVFDTAQHSNQAPTSESSQIIGAFSSLIQELRGLVSNAGSSVPIQAARSAAAQTQHATPGSAPLSSPNDLQHQPRKRRRVDSCGNPNIELASQLNELGSTSSQLPPPELLEEVINAYFILVQPWIPILHETRFRSRFYNHEQLPCLTVLLHAIVVAAIRFVDTDNEKLSETELETWTTRSRSIVLLSAMDGMSVENLQALSIIAFTDMGNGDMSRAWPIIGSLTRTVEYLQLSVETDDRQQGPLLKPLTSLSPSENWTQDEERRRVFWSIFNLDRWNTSLTSDDVRRRLPADGGLWHKEETVLTPYFGIWDRSAAKMGNSIVFLPAHYPSPDQVTEAPPETPSTNTTAPKGNDTVDMTTVGAFAYCIEATESLSRVTTYFLQQRINFRDRQEVGNWLTRFKELDLRLVHWKMFLPQKWKDSNISRRPTIINMDPNLTLAHITHNTSMILLHQQIAYPAPQWTSIVRMPSAHSAETCQIAAAETATITQKYLKYTPENSPVNSQFAFCVFVSARALLVHWKFYKTDLAPEFWVLVESLDNFAKRWAGPFFRSKSKSCLAEKYSAQLRALHKKCEEDPDYSPDVVGYSTDGFVTQASNAPGQQQTNNRHSRQNQIGSISSLLQSSFDNGSQSAQHPVNPASSQVPGNQLSFLPQISPTNPGVEHNSPDELSAISTVLMDQDFMQLDRVISFDDMMFTAQTIDDQGGPFSMNNWTLG